MQEGRGRGRNWWARSTAHGMRDCSGQGLRIPSAALAMQGKKGCRHFGSAGCGRC